MVWKVFASWLVEARDSQSRRAKELVQEAVRRRVSAMVGADVRKLQKLCLRGWRSVASQREVERKRTQKSLLMVMIEGDTDRLKLRFLQGWWELGLASRRERETQQLEAGWARRLAEELAVQRKELEKERVRREQAEQEAERWEAHANWLMEEEASGLASAAEVSKAKRETQAALAEAQRWETRSWKWSRIQKRSARSWRRSRSSSPNSRSWGRSGMRPRHAPPGAKRNWRGCGKRRNNCERSWRRSTPGISF